MLLLYDLQLWRSGPVDLYDEITSNWWNKLSSFSTHQIWQLQKLSNHHFFVQHIRGSDWMNHLSAAHLIGLMDTKIHFQILNQENMVEQSEKAIISLKNTHKISFSIEYSDNGFTMRITDAMQKTTLMESSHQKKLTKIMHQTLHTSYLKVWSEGKMTYLVCQTISIKWFTKDNVFHSLGLSSTKPEQTQSQSMPDQSQFKRRKTCSSGTCL